VTLTLIVLAHMLRMTRASIIGVMSQPFIEMAFLKGMHAGESLCSTLCPMPWRLIINVVAINRTVGRVIVVEVVFVYPALASSWWTRLSNRDVPVVQACGLIFAATYIGLNMAADLLAILTNPLLRAPK